MYPFISAFNGKHASSLRAYVYYVGPTPSEVKQQNDENTVIFSRKTRPNRHKETNPDLASV